MFKSKILPNTKDNIDKRLLEYADKDIHYTEKGQIFKRSGSCDEICKDCKVKPTTDDCLVSNILDISGDIKGFFTGDQDEWIPILLRDNYLRGEGEICIGEFEFPEKTPYITNQRNVAGLIKKTTVEEQFIIYDKPITPITVRELTDSEYNDFEIEAENISLNEWEDDDLEEIEE